jgi:hypothetical protein
LLNSIEGLLSVFSRQLIDRTHKLVLVQFAITPFFSVKLQGPVEIQGGCLSQVSVNARSTFETLFSSRLCLEKHYLVVAIHHPDSTTPPPRNTPYIVWIPPRTGVIMVDFFFFTDGSGGPGRCVGVGGGGVGGSGGAGGSFDLVGVLAGFIDQLLIKRSFSIDFFYSSHSFVLYLTINQSRGG